MKDVTEYTEQEILDTKTPEELFTGDADAAKAEHRKLAAKWHTDHNPGSDAVLAHVNMLYDKAQTQLNYGVWKTPKGIKVRFTGAFGGVDAYKAGAEYSFKYLREHKFELGEFYLGTRNVLYLVERQHKDLYEHGIKAVQTLAFKDHKMQMAVSRMLPMYETSFETTTRYGLLVRKEPGLLCLADVITHLGPVEPRHVAWMVSRLYSIAGYLGWAKRVHMSANPHTVFIDPKEHAGALIGGWWYDTAAGAKLQAAPEATVALLPSATLRGGKAAHSITGEQIKAVGRALLGDPPTSIHKHKDVPPAMLEWLYTPAREDPFNDYEGWAKVLKDSFGARRFVELKLTASDLYKE